MCLQVYKKSLVTLKDNYYSKDIELERPGSGDKKKYTVFTSIPKAVEKVECPICFNLLNDPVSVCSNSGKHITCRECKEKSDKLKKCPLCQLPREPAVPIEPQLQIYFKIQKVICPAGCMESFSLDELSKHFWDCRPLSCLNCAFQGNYYDMEEHEKQCKPPLEKCHHCDEEYKPQERADHLEKCQNLPVLVEMPGGERVKVAQKYVKNVELVMDLYNRKRPPILAKSDTETKQKLAPDIYTAIEEGLKIVFDYYKSQHTAPTGKGAREAGRYFNPEGFDFVSMGLLDDCGRLKNNSEVLAKFDLQHHNNQPIDQREIMVYIPHYNKLAHCPLTCKSLTMCWFSLSGTCNKKLVLGLSGLKDINEYDLERIKIELILEFFYEHPPEKTIKRMTLAEFKRYSLPVNCITGLNNVRIACDCVTTDRFLPKDAERMFFSCFRHSYQVQCTLKQIFVDPE